VLPLSHTLHRVADAIGFLFLFGTNIVSLVTTAPIFDVL
jgi:hypothetical protein